MKKVCTHKGFDIYFEAEEELECMDNHFLVDCGWTNEQYEALLAKHPVWFSAKVVAKRHGVELGCAYLGCCCYDSFEDFYVAHYEGHLREMMLEVAEEAESKLIKLLET